MEAFKPVCDFGSPSPCWGDGGDDASSSLCPRGRSCCSRRDTSAVVSAGVWEPSVAEHGVASAESLVRLRGCSLVRRAGSQEEPGFGGPEAETWKDRGCYLHATAACPPYPCFSASCGRCSDRQPNDSSASSPDTLRSPPCRGLTPCLGSPSLGSRMRI